MTGPRDSALLKRERRTRSTIVIALLANLLIVVAKAIGGLVTGSPALLSEAAHSVADSVNELFLLAGLNHSSRQPDAKHPFGYGKARYFYSMLLLILLDSNRSGIIPGALHSAQARTATIRSRLINIPARLAYSAGTYTLHLPATSRNEPRFMAMYDTVHAPPQAA